MNDKTDDLTEVIEDIANTNVTLDVRDMNPLDVRAHGPVAQAETRGWLEVAGEDRVRWLDGMISGDVEALAAGDEGSGCYATLLTNRGAIVARSGLGTVGPPSTGTYVAMACLRNPNSVLRTGKRSVSTRQWLSA